MLTILVISAAVYTIAFLNPKSTSITDYLILGVFLSGLLLSPKATVLILFADVLLIGLLPLLSHGFDMMTLYDDMAFVTILGAMILIAAKILKEDLQQIENQSHEISQSEKRFRVLIENASEAILLLDEQGVILFTSSSSSRITGYITGENIGKSIFELIHPDDQSKAHEIFARILQTSRILPFTDFRYLHKDGAWRRMEGIATNFLREPDVKAIVLNYRDITERHLAEGALQESEKRYRGLFEHSPISLWEEDFSSIKIHLDDLKAQGVTDIHAYLLAHPQAVAEWAKQVKIIDVNNATLKLYKANNKAELLKNLGRIFNDDSYRAFRGELEMIAEGRTEFEWEGVDLTMTGEELIVSLSWSVAPGYEDSLARVIISVADVTERTRATEKLEYVSTHDALTELYNRSYFNQEFERLEQGRQFPVSVVMVDLDHMKTINDNYGHAVGDKLLQRAAHLLMAAFRNDDVVARIGGDEFAVLLPRTKSSLADQKMVHIKELLQIHNRDIQGIPLSLSIGTATEEHGVSLSEILKAADDNMYLEKQSKQERRAGRNQIKD